MTQELRCPKCDERSMIIDKGYLDPEAPEPTEEKPGVDPFFWCQNCAYTRELNNAELLMLSVFGKVE